VKRKKPAADVADPALELRLEAALSRLESVVEELDAGELELEDSLERFEEGVRLVRLCSERLRSAEVRLLELREGPDGLSVERLELDDGGGG